jgi:predicted transcriptional regulator
MAYDSSLDQQLFVKDLESEKGKISVSVYSYNNGPKKLQLSRSLKDEKGNYSFAKLGRLTKEELQSVLPLLQEALAAMSQE